MTSKDKTGDRAPREDTLGPLLDRLKPDEAATVFRRLLKAHPDLSSEADEIARSLLRQVEYEDVAAEIEDEIRALDYEDLNARAGGHEWGYIEPSEAAWEILRKSGMQEDDEAPDSPPRLELPGNRMRRQPEESRHPSKNAPPASSGLPQHGSQVDSNDRAYLKRDDVIHGPAIVSPTPGPNAWRGALVYRLLFRIGRE